MLYIIPIFLFSNNIKFEKNGVKMRKKSKIILGGVLAGVLATTLIIALLPVMLYGFSVDTVTVSWNPTASVSAATSNALGLDSQDSSDFDDITFSGDLTLYAEHVVYNPYAYFQTKFQGNVHASASWAAAYLEQLGIHIRIEIQLDVTNPLGQSGQFYFYLENLAAVLNIDMVIGSDMMQIVNGTYYFEMSATFSLEVDGFFSGSYTEDINGSIDIIIIY